MKFSFTDQHNSTVEVQTNLVGAYNFENALAASAIGTYFDVAAGDIKHAIESYKPHNHRSQLKTTSTNELIMDMYNANPSSMKAAIENFSQMKKDRKVLIIGDMLELGDTSIKEHQNIIQFISEKNYMHVFLVGKWFNKALSYEDASANIKGFGDTKELISFLSDTPIKYSTILIKASRSLGLEKIIDCL
jgi:UDP-N-acetylmuramoyl-tripeptide--D-alanyl-D-alanine ligase